MLISLISARVMLHRPAAPLRSLILPAGLLVLALLLAGSPLHAQQPDRRAPDRPLPDRPLPERLAPDRGEAQAPSERGRTRVEALTRRRAQPSAPTSLTNTPANLFTRAGAGLTGVRFGSSSTLGDVDGDGTLDLVITGADQNRNPTTTVYLGDGSGGFSEANAGLTGVGYYSSSTLGDVDGDGNLDLVITGSGTATLYLGDGSGGFSEANAGLTGVRGSSSTLGDVDGDGNLDLVITGRDQNDNRTSTLYLGDGSGGFSEAGAGLTGVRDGSSTLGDVDGDGNLDLVITGLDQNNDPTTTLYLGDGSGGFSEAGAGLAGARGGSSTLGDVDRDGNLDLVITGIGTTLYLGDGSGGFSEADAGLTGVSSGSSTLGDVDGDGNPDLVITGSSDNGRISTLYLGDGSGGFSEAGAGLTGVRFGSSSTLGDVDGDGDLDLVVTGSDALFGASARVYVNRTVQEPPNQDPVFARFPEPFAVAPGRTATRFVEAGDADGDPLTLSLTQGGGVDGVSFTDAGNGVAELTFTPSRSQAGQSFTVSVEASDGNGGTATGSFTVDVGDKFAPLDAGLTGMERSSSTLGDVDGDGNLDLVITGVDQNRDPTTTLYLGDGSGGFSEANAGLAGVDSGSSTPGDVDGDGHLDLVITGFGDIRPMSTLYLGDGSGEFSEAGAGLAGVRYSSSTVGDVDGDGNLDLVVTGEDQNLVPTTTLYLGDGSGGFSEADAGLAGVSRSSSTLGDVDGDGNLDLVITGRDQYFNPTTTVYLGDGSGGFSEADAGLAGVWRSSSTVGDMDGDGHLDLVITGVDQNNDPTTTLYLGDGSGGFSEADAGLTGVRFGSSTVGDVDGDGNLDLVVTGVDQNDDETTTVYLGDGSGGFSEANAGLAGVGLGSSTLGDVDGDGNPDLVTTGFGDSGPTATLYENLSSQNYQVASVTQPVSGDGTTAFGDTGAEIQFAGTSGSGDVTVQRFSNGPTALRGIPEENVSSYRFVISAGGDLTVGDDTEVRLDVSTLGGIGDASNVTVYKRSVRGRGPFAALSTSHDGAENELVAETGAFSEFVLASNTEPLPVELASFEANTTDEEAAVLRWTTASETNNAGFAVQHRADSTGAWEQLGFVESKAPGGTSPDAQTYRFRTDALDVGTHGFRLQQVDTDGTTRVSRAVQARVSMDEPFRLTSHPNPVQRQATVKVAVRTEQEVQLRLYDVLGRRLATLYDGPLPAQESRAMPLRPDDLGLSSGAYFLRLVGEDGTRTRRLTVVR